jgi:hypothetical protein
LAPSFDRFTLTIAQGRKFGGEYSNRVKFSGEARFFHIAAEA